jgi:hypothetical protein
MTFIPPEYMKPPIDEIMTAVWDTRAALLRKYGGLHGLALYLQQKQAEVPPTRIRSPRRLARRDETQEQL